MRQANTGRRRAGVGLAMQPFKDVLFSVMPRAASSAVKYCNSANSLPSAMLTFATSPCAAESESESPGLAASYAQSANGSGRATKPIKSVGNGSGRAKKPMKCKGCGAYHALKKLSKMHLGDRGLDVADDERSWPFLRREGIDLFLDLQFK